MIIFTPTVGVAPGTTTMQLGGACPPDPVIPYTFPPATSEVITPSYTDVAAMTATRAAASVGGVWWPYADDARLRGLDRLPGGELSTLGSGWIPGGSPVPLGATTPNRWGLAVLTGVVAFSIVLFLRRRKR
jgi:hypothetical protein